MNTIFVLFETFLMEETGAAAIEYGLIASSISVAIISAVGSIGQTLSHTFEMINDGLNH